MTIDRISSLRILALSLGLVLICVTNEILGGRTTLVLRLVERSLTANGEYLTFSVGFQASKRPTAVWTERAYSPANALGSTLEYDESSKEGKTTVTVNKKSSGLFLQLGYSDSQMFYMKMRLTGLSNLSHDFNLSAVEIFPGVDLPYASGEKVRVVFKVPVERGNNVSFHRSSPAWHPGVLVDLRYDGKISYPRPTRELCTEVVNTTDEMVITSLTCDTDNITVNGILQGTFYTSLNVPSLPETFPLSDLDENFVLRLHEDQYSGPFPDHTVIPDWWTQSKNACLVGNTRCFFGCQAMANELHSIEFYRVRAKGSMQKVPTTVEFQFMKYKWRSVFTVDTSGDFEGTYLCRGTSEGGAIVKDISRTIHRVENAVTIDRLDVVTRPNGTKRVTCTVTGSGPMLVRLGASHNVTRRYFGYLRDGMPGLLSYTPVGPTPMAANASYSAIADLTDNVEFNEIRCVASNWASYKRKKLHVG